MITFPLFISGAEIFFIVFIVVMVFGADKVPEIARGLGKGIRQIKDATNDIKSEINKSAKKEGIDLESTEKLKEVYHMAVWCVIRDVGVKHFSQEVIFDTKDSVEFVLD